MKILHIIPSISPLRGGPSAAVLAMVTSLRQRGVEAAILTSNDDGPGIDPSMPTGRWFERDGVPVLAFKRWSPPLSPLSEFAICPAMNRWLASHLGNYDLLHIHALFSWPSTTAMAQARRHGKPFVLSTIGQLNHWSLGQSRIRKRLFWKLIEQRNLAAAAALHFTTDEERDQAAVLNLPTPTWVVPLGVELPPTATAPIDVAPAATIPTFLFLSRLHPKKQLEHLLEALALLQEQQPERSWQLQIAGDGDPSYVAGLRRQALELGLAHRCQWLGFLEGEAKWQALQGADWFVLPSASENFGIAVIEALAAGTPAILSPEVAVASAIARAGAGLVCSSEPRTLAATLADALARPSVSMCQAAVELAASDYSWPVIAAQLENAYSTLSR